MTYAIFEGRTGKMGAALRARGKNVAKIDKALKAYEKKILTGSVAERLVLVAALIRECEAWLKAKSVGTGVGSELFKRRRSAIKDLATQSLAELLVLNPAALADVAFSTRKVETLAAGRGETAGLAPGYAHERTDYLGNKKRDFPISGSQVHMVHKNLGEFAATETKLAGKRFEELTFADFQKIHKLAGREQMAEQVDFLTKADRKAYLAIPHGGTFIDGTGHPFNAPNPVAPGSRYPYAIDDYGNFFTKEEGSTRAPKFNHSSFNAGKSVTCAGMTAILNGRLLYLDNNSGHYKPTKQNLHTAVKVLAQEGIDLSSTGVCLYDYSTGAQKVYLYKATNFHANINYGFPRLVADDFELRQILIDLANNALW
jgi:hypothetical protein